MGQNITWCKHCWQVISFEMHAPHYHEHDNEHKHNHTVAHVDHDYHDHGHDNHGECKSCIKKGSLLKGN